MSQALISLFDKDNMSQLENLGLCGTDAVVDDVVKVIALNCPMLKYLDLQKAPIIHEETVGMLIKHLSSLAYLCLRECYDMDNNQFIKEALMETSRSQCLKVNTWEGIITWKYETRSIQLVEWP